MKGQISKYLMWLVILSVIASMVLVGCGQTAAPEEPAATEAPAEQPTEAAAAPTEAPAPAEKVVNRAGVELPDDAAPIEEQVLYRGDTEYTWLSWVTDAYDYTPGPLYGIHDSCVRPDKEFNPQPSACESWEVSDDGLTWTFYLPEDKVWSDGEPVTAEDWVFTLQRLARAEYNFEWFYSMAGIQNWGAVASGELPPEELGAKVVDDYTFTVTTDQPAPFLVKMFADLWVVPEHIVQDRLADGSWALDPEKAISAGPYKLDYWTKGVEIVWVANDKYTGPYPPMMDKIVTTFMTPETRWNAYQNGEVDVIGYGYEVDLPPAALAQIMADPAWKEQLLVWPNFVTHYLYFDTWNEPFDNLKVRQAISHAIDRDAIVNGPLQYQASAAYTMNPPGFPGESVEELKSVQNYDPELAAQLMEEAGYPGGEGFPKLTMYMRAPYPALTNAGEAIVGMLENNLGIEAEIQSLDYSMFMEGLNAQKRDETGPHIFAFVPYEYDFVDGSNLLSVWGGCEEEGASMPDMPGRHTWHNAEYNDLVCEANAIIGDEDRRNELYRQAERILIEDAALVPIYHANFNVMVNPRLAGPALEPNANGVVTFRGFRFNSSEGQVYRTAE
jgi:peptide/nickel transport system substrate-binding protein/oligopeptide transport system substrate-binding protein